MTILRQPSGSIYRVLFIVILSGSLVLSSHGNNRLATKMEIDQFLNSTTCIVVEGGMLPFNLYIKDAVEEHWKITEFEFIDREEFEAKRHDPDYSFLMLVRGTFEKDPMGVSYDYITLVLGNEAGEVSGMPELASLPVSYSDDEMNEYGYALPAIVKFLQHHVGKLQERRWLISVLGLKYYNFGKNFDDNTLLLNEQLMAPDAVSMEEIQSVYPHDFQMVSFDEIREKIDTGADSTLFLFHVGPAESSRAGRCFEMIFDTNGRLHYYRSRDVTNDNPDGFTLSDFRRIS